DVGPQLGGGPIAEVEVADVGVRKVRGQQAQARQQRRPAPSTRLQLEDLDLECVPRFGAVNVDRPAQRIQPVEVELAQLGGRVALLDLARRHLLGVEVDDVARRDLHRRFQRVVPLVVELVATDPVLLYPRPNAHLRTSSLSPSLMGTAFARRTFLSNLPTDVFGTSSMKRTSSGTHHLATFSFRNSLISSWV